MMRCGIPSCSPDQLRSLFLQHRADARKGWQLLLFTAETIGNVTVAMALETWAPQAEVEQACRAVRR